MSSVTMEWESRLGRRFRVRDLYILSTVVKSGGMAKAARQLAMTQPSVSTAIANLEHMLGVRLLDRSPRGIEPTIYADAILKRSIAVFDELKQSVKDVEFACRSRDRRTEDRVPGLDHRHSAPAVHRTFFQKISAGRRARARCTFSRDQESRMRDRKYDLVFARLGLPVSNDRTTDDLNLEYLFDDPLMIAAGLRSRWARRRTIDLAELKDEPWLLAQADMWQFIGVAEAFRAQGLDMPTVGLFGFSLHLVNHFVANGSFLTAYRTVGRTRQRGESATRQIA